MDSYFSISVIFLKSSLKLGVNRKCDANNRLSNARGILEKTRACSRDPADGCEDFRKNHGAAYAVSSCNGETRDKTKFKGPRAKLLNAFYSVDSGIVTAKIFQKNSWPRPPRQNMRRRCRSTLKNNKQQKRNACHSTENIKAVYNSGGVPMEIPFIPLNRQHSCHYHTGKRRPRLECMATAKCAPYS
jgi:hypothetical protein